MKNRENVINEMMSTKYSMLKGAMLRIQNVKNVKC